MFNVIYKLISFSFIFAFRINIFCLHIFIHFRINIFVYIFLYISEYIFFCFINVPLHVVQIFDEKFECSKACLTSFLPSTLHLSFNYYWQKTAKEFRLLRVGVANIIKKAGVIYKDTIVVYSECSLSQPYNKKIAKGVKKCVIEKNWNLMTMIMF